jgi:hypothetical protein
MNMAELKKMAKNVNYIKPELEMFEFETEGSLLLTASDTRMVIKSSNGESNSIQSVRSSGRVILD